ncbi:hypothetical protein FZ934_20190 (plasmid) [Rhizobium grahamii]|uniref:Uncharacterized protein n=1 Tax=Rhizobium grahamii TaxID=1120045 RepID=A0A5Q0CB75_9HYPH|nr:MULTISPECIES: hypothetical protein [Rhizobium]QFY62702.1 hypothetical protein FZ934_20190 [Rhizobium grahamii]QRM52554.1 hypothetical protein F3Y33_25470 [Rhizobium sp. BG6]
MYLRNVLLDIKDRLRPITRDLGLRHKLRSANFDDLCLCFERTDEDGILWRAPVTFVFPSAENTGQKELTWEHVRVGVEKVTIRPIGDNGWIQYVGAADNCGEPIGKGERFKTMNAALKGAAVALHLYPLAPVDLYVPFVIEDVEAGDMWPHLRRQCRQAGIHEINFGRSKDKSEFFSFKFHESLIEIVYRAPPAYHADIVIDGQVRATQNNSNRWRILSYLEMYLEDIERESASRHRR